MRPHIPALILLAASAAWAADEHGDDEDHLAEAEGVRVLHAWIEETRGPEARVYLEIENTGSEELILKGGDTGIAGAVTLVGLDFNSGGSTPVPLGELPIPAGNELELTPDGVFLLITDLAKPLAEGEEFEMHIELEPVGEIEIHVDVEAEGTLQHPHAGHNH